MNFLSDFSSNFNEATISTEKFRTDEAKEMPIMAKEVGDVRPENSLSLFEKVVVKIENPDWTFKTIDNIKTIDEYKVYKAADLDECKVGEKAGLIRDDIDFNQKDEFGRTNSERIKSSLSPITKSGEIVELHHVGQNPDSPLAELTRDQHRGVGNDTILHQKDIESRIDREEFQKEKSQYWKTRLEME